MKKYLRNIKEAVSTLSEGLKLTLGYLADARNSRTPIGIENAHYFDQDRGIVTLQYPHESLPVPDNARYRLHNEIDDCIVCDKCAKVCPVDCIDIEAIRAPETFGVTSDGTPRRIHAAKFDIDMGKCCFCGLCTTVCPTECLTMTKVYDFSEFDVKDHVYSFATMTLAEIARKRKELEEFEAQKAAAKSSEEQLSSKNVTAQQKLPGARPLLKPKPGKPILGTINETPDVETGSSAESPKARPVMKKPAIKPKIQPTDDGSQDAAMPQPKPVVKRPGVKPVIKAEEKSTDENQEVVQTQPARPRPVMKKPVVKPRMDEPVAGGDPAPELVQPESKVKKPVISAQEDPKQDQAAEQETVTPPKYRPRPVIRKKPKEDGDQ